MISGASDDTMHQKPVTVPKTLEVDDSAAVSNLRQHEEHEQEGSVVGSAGTRTSDKVKEMNTRNVLNASQIQLQEESADRSKMGCKRYTALGKKRQLSPVRDSDSVTSLPPGPLVNDGEITDHPAKRVKHKTTSVATHEKGKQSSKLDAAVAVYST